MRELIEKLDWKKMENLIPVVVQDHMTRQVLMLGYMNQEALQTTMDTKRVTFYSRSKQRLWTKGETSEHFLDLVDIIPDCDQDALLILANPHGPCCHLQTMSCFKQENTDIGFLMKLYQFLVKRYQERPESSYTTNLFIAGTKRIAQKVGEEGVEVALAAMQNEPREIISESADLLFHLLVLLVNSKIDLGEVIKEMAARHKE